MDRYGKVKNVTIGINRRTGRSRGYAFVEFDTRRDAEDAYDHFQGYILDGRRLRLDWDIGIDRKRQIRYQRRHYKTPKYLLFLENTNFTLTERLNCI